MHLLLRGNIMVWVDESVMHHWGMAHTCKRV
ncbi:hypothetical protein SIAM614_00100 [Stappia aggregata IAM 12614]|uniref:Uncharacterized protein n=1 Tax=Roseibium aggregatum (strain ATCC 25650 / DSM 13394 / JCM 20685 / NBRC 16684 / NCIMB 2208 / IAM 12614 / B1) TaxID=384765 RepID=A0P463_ROSAI|nr:hypothetical protein SIAM614_00100 [Stappia aggregata IAM 12614] [Roseibium aggregatum IAM 12614]